MNKTLKVYQFDSQDVVANLTLNPTISDYGVKEHLIHQVIVAENAATRQATRKVKTRGEVSGTGKKPWKQKGLGLARHGSKRSPIWTGGGVAHGPKQNASFKLKTNRKVVRGALISAFNLAFKNDQISVVTDLSMKEFSTKKILNFLNACEYSKAKNVLLVVNQDQINKELIYSIANVQNILLKNLNQVSVKDLVINDRIIFTKDALTELQERMLKYEII